MYISTLTFTWKNYHYQAEKSNKNGQIFGDNSPRIIPHYSSAIITDNFGYLLNMSLNLLIRFYFFPALKLHNQSEIEKEELQPRVNIDEHEDDPEELEDMEAKIASGRSKKRDIDQVKNDPEYDDEDSDDYSENASKKDQIDAKFTRRMNRRLRKHDRRQRRLSRRLQRRQEKHLLVLSKEMNRTEFEAEKAKIKANKKSSKIIWSKVNNLIDSLKKMLNNNMEPLDDKNYDDLEKQIDEEISKFYTRLENIRKANRMNQV